uniref:hypothetical protein n=1 Tax=Rhizobium sp. F40D2 TaxID=3453141 RepID=UPI003F274A30
MISSACPLCEGKRLRKESLSVTFEGLDYAEINRLPMAAFKDHLLALRECRCREAEGHEEEHPEKAMVVQRIAADLCRRLSVLVDLGLGYLTLERSTPTLSPGNSSGYGWPPSGLEPLRRRLCHGRAVGAAPGGYRSCCGRSTV